MSAVEATAVRRPRLGFAGVGWIGLNRLQAVAAGDVAEIVCITDVSADCTARALAALQEPTVRAARSFQELLDEDLDGVVIATPSGLHAQQTVAALEHGHAVFCQKPLARTAPETARTLAAARAYDRLLEVDFCYRTVAGVPQLLGMTQGGAIGEIFAADLVFHNAYGPDKPWFYDLAQSGGGCVMDLGIHLIDLLLLAMGGVPVAKVRSRLYAGGKLLAKPAEELEDHALIEVEFVSGATARIACSWRLSAGQDAVISASFYGTRGALILSNIGGSFYDFSVDHCEGTRRHTLAAGPDDWGGRAVNTWARQLGRDCGFSSNALRLQDVSDVIDAIYGRE